MFNLINGLVEASIHWYEQQPTVIKVVVGVILIKNILLRWISDEIRHVIFEPLGKYMKTRIMEGKKDRQLIIQSHVYENHQAQLDHCQQGACELLGKDIV